MKWLGTAALACAFACSLSAPASAATKKPDLLVSKLTVKPTRLTAGVFASVEATVANRGRAAARTSTLEVALTRVPAGAFPLPAAVSVRVRGLAAGSERRVRLKLALPAGSAAGRYRLRACADSRSRLREGRESNNCAVARNRIRLLDTTPPPAPRVLAAVLETPTGLRLRFGVHTEPFALVRLSFQTCSHVAFATGRANGSGVFDHEIPLHGHTSQLVRATAEDLSGLTSPCGGTFYANPLLALPTPTLSATQAGTRVSLHASAPRAERVLVFDNGTCAGEPLASLAGATLHSGVLLEVPHARRLFTARAIGKYDVHSPCTAAVPYDPDATPYFAPVVESSIPSPGNTPSISLYADLAEDESIVVYDAPDCTGPELKKSTLDGVSVPVAQDATTDFGVVVRDAARRQSPCSPFVFVESSRWEVERNDSYLSARGVATNHGVLFDQTESYFGRIWPDENDVDTYKLSLTTASSVLVDLLDTSGQDTCAGDVDLRLELLDEDGGIVLADSNAGTDSCPQLDFDAEAGTYYLRVGDDTADPEASPTYEYRLATEFAPLP